MTDCVVKGDDFMLVRLIEDFYPPFCYQGMFPSVSPFDSALMDVD